MTDLAALVLADMLMVAADDLGVVLSMRDARHLAARALEHLAVGGYELARTEDQ